MLNEVDIAIIGGGNAGLTLAAQLAAQLTPPTTVVLEPQTPEQRDCSWGLWARQSQAQQLSPATKGRWRRWQLIDHRQRVVHCSEQFNYLSLSSANYLQSRADALRGPVSLVQASVTALNYDGDRVVIETDKTQYRAKKVYDSRPPTLIENGLRQHFIGWHIRTKKPIQEQDVATLMDFRVDQSRGLHFVYALPFSDHHLLVESTVISNTLEPSEWYRAAIETWLRDNNIDVEEIISEEMGAIPMDTLVKGQSATEAKFRGQVSPIGAASGAVRRSSGYAFQHIQQQTTELAEGIAHGRMAVPTPISSRLTMMDTVFNGVLNSRPDLSVSLYMRMANALNGDQFARFMLGQATALDWLRVIAAMPKLPFLAQCLRQLRHD